MLPNYILAGLAALFFILCVLASIAERSPSDKAFARNLFRGLKLAMRETGALLFAAAAAVLVIAAIKWDGLDIVWTCCSIGAAALGLIILNSFRIFGRLRSLRKRRKRRVLGWAGEVPFTKEAAELREAKEALPARELRAAEVSAEAENA